MTPTPRTAATMGRLLTEAAEDFGFMVQPHDHLAARVASDTLTATLYGGAAGIFDVTIERCFDKSGGGYVLTTVARGGRPEYHTTFASVLAALGFTHDD